MRRGATTIMGFIVVACGLTGCVSGRSASLMPTCPDTVVPVRPVLILEAQAVPTATYLPCVRELPSGWSFSGFEIAGGENGGTVRFWLDDPYAEVHAVEVTLAATCDSSQAFEGEVDPDHPDARIFDETVSLPPDFSGSRYLVFPGGCVSYRYRFSKGVPAALVLATQQALNLVPRGPVVDKVKADLDLTLCGAGAPPCHG